MKIDERNPQVVMNPPRNEGVEQSSLTDKPLSNTSEKPSSGKDTVEFSPNVERANKVTATLKDLPDVRADKVAELKSKIEANDYRVSGRDVAEKILGMSRNGYTS